MSRVVQGSCAGPFDPRAHRALTQAHGRAFPVRAAASCAAGAAQEREVAAVARRLPLTAPAPARSAAP
jgi:hypothetical protein